MCIQHKDKVKLNYQAEIGIETRNPPRLAIIEHVNTPPTRYEYIFMPKWIWRLPLWLLSCVGILVAWAVSLIGILVGASRVDNILVSIGGGILAAELLAIAFMFAVVTYDSIKPFIWYKTKIKN